MAVEKVNSPNVVKGRLQLEQLSIRTDDDRVLNNNSERHRWEASYGFSERVDVAIDLAAAERGRDSMEPAAVGIRPRYQLTRQDDAGWWLASAIQAKYNAALNSDNDELSFRLLLQRQQGPWISTVNIGLARELGGGRVKSVDARAAAQVIYQATQEISPGFEYFTGFGMLNNQTEFSDQPNMVGPILTGDLPIDADSAFAYVAGYYWGLTGQAPDTGARLQLNYVRQF